MVVSLARGRGVIVGGDVRLPSFLESTLALGDGEANCGRTCLCSRNVLCDGLICELGGVPGLALYVYLNAILWSFPVDFIRVSY